MDRPLRRIIDGVESIRFPVHQDHRGGLVAIDHQQGLPFELKRVFYVFDVPGAAERAGHAITADCVCIAARGSLDLTVLNGRETGSLRIDHPSLGVWVKAGIFMRASGFSADALFLVLSSHCFADVEYKAEPFFYRSRDPR